MEQPESDDELMEAFMNQFGKGLRRKMTMETQCAFCSEVFHVPESVPCGFCRVRYCNTECLRMDFQNHRVKCSAKMQDYDSDSLDSNESVKEELVLEKIRWNKIQSSMRVRRSSYKVVEDNAVEVLQPEVEPELKVLQDKNTNNKQLKESSRDEAYTRKTERLLKKRSTDGSVSSDATVLVEDDRITEVFVMSRSSHSDWEDNPLFDSFDSKDSFDDNQDTLPPVPLKINPNNSYSKRGVSEPVIRMPSSNTPRNKANVQVETSSSEKELVEKQDSELVEDPELQQFYRLKEMQFPLQMIHEKMKQAGYDPSLIQDDTIPYFSPIEPSKGLLSMARKSLSSIGSSSSLRAFKSEKYGVAWADKSIVHDCNVCLVRFSSIRVFSSSKKHHCRSCGSIVCTSCSTTNHSMRHIAPGKRVCTTCYTK